MAAVVESQQQSSSIGKVILEVVNTSAAAFNLRLCNISDDAASASSDIADHSSSCSSSNKSAPLSCSSNTKLFFLFPFS